MGCWSPWFLQAFRALTLKKLQLCDVQYQHLHEHVQIHDKKQTMFSISVCFRDIHHSSFSTPPCCSVSPARRQSKTMVKFHSLSGSNICVCLWSYVAQTLPKLPSFMALRRRFLRFTLQSMVPSNRDKGDEEGKKDTSILSRGNKSHSWKTTGHLSL